VLDAVVLEKCLRETIVGNRDDPRYPRQGSSY